MAKINKIKIISGLIAVIIFPLLGFLIENLMILINVLDEYGYIGSSDFKFLYNLFYVKDGLYNMPSKFHYLIMFLLTFIIVFKLINFAINKSNKSENRTTN